jgi:ferritin-like metal-binding protein YciE
VKKTSSSRKKSATRKSATRKRVKSASKKSRSIETLHDAFIYELSDMRNAEQQLTKALPKMAKAASNQQLAEAFETHLEETEHQIELIDRAVESADIKLKREKCEAMEGLVKEGGEVIEEVESGPVRDALLIAAAQKVEHYEIASYGSLVAIARELGLSEAADYLEQILDQEKQTDEILNQLAEQGINEEAAMQDEENVSQRYKQNGRGHDRSYGSIGGWFGGRENRAGRHGYSGGR